MERSRASTPASEMKAALRESVKSRLRLLLPEEIQDRSAAAQDRLLKSEPYRSARRIGVYLSMPSGEVLTQAIVEHALCEGKEVFVPYLHKNPGVTHANDKGYYLPKRLMNMVSLHSLQDYQSLERDKWGIPSPDKTTVAQRRHALGDLVGQPVKRKLLIDGLDLIVMPGMAFDRKCNRLGHGKGFYDFFLAEYLEAASSLPSRAVQGAPLPVLVALSLPQQILPDGEIPTESHDHTLDMIVTDSETIRRDSAAS